MTELIATKDISLSQSGKNIHTVNCDATGQTRHYCVCLSHIGKIQKGQTAESYADCNRAYRSDSCAAKVMRAEEEKAGESLYYALREHVGETVKFNRVADRTSPSYLRGRFDTRPFVNGVPTVEAKNTTKSSAPAKTKKKTVSMTTMNHAELVNQIVVEEKTKKTVKSAVSIKPLPGESPRDFAMRRRKSVIL